MTFYIHNVHHQPIHGLLQKSLSLVSQSIHWFLQQGRKDQLQYIFQLENCFRLWLQFMVRLQHWPPTWWSRKLKDRVNSAAAHPWQ